MGIEGDEQHGDAAAFGAADPERIADLDTPPPDDPQLSGLLLLALVAAVAGVGIGLVGGLFRRLLVELDLWRDHLLAWAQGAGPGRWLVPVAVGAAAAAAARLVVRWAPEAAGSGVQRVEAHLRGAIDAAPPRVLPAKFVGGLLSIGVGGLLLGREGPTVQMGATLGALVARWSRMTVHDIRTVTAALGGAGLGVAFNAPLGGALFVVEEVAHAFRTRLVVATLVATASALVVARLVVGGAVVLPVGVVVAGPGWLLVAYTALGVLLGALGVAYNRLVVRLLDLMSSVGPRLAPELKAAAIGALVMAIGVGAPWLVGGGDGLNLDILVGSVSVSTLLVAVVVRWFLGPLSYSAGTPGGLFAPLLVVGAGIGALSGHVAAALDPALVPTVTAFAVVGMSSFFAGVVRAPVTGVVLIMEMTGQTTLAVPMVAAAAAAVITATLLHGPPIYDTLRLRLHPSEATP